VIVAICANCTKNYIDEHPSLILEFLFLAVLILYCIINILWLCIEEDGDTNEPRLTRWICSIIGKFFRDISRPLDEQEEVDAEDKKKRKEEKKKKVEARKEKKRKAREAKNAEANKFDRFEVMEIVE